jgi:hypothetical protein
MAILALDAKVIDIPKGVRGEDICIRYVTAIKGIFRLYLQDSSGRIVL